MTHLPIRFEPDDPKGIVRTLEEIANQIETSKGRLTEISDRDWFHRLFSNNTRDVAEAMIAQNDSLGLFLEALRTLIGLHLGNSAQLRKVWQEFVRTERSRNGFQSRYMKTAKEFFGEALSAAEGLDRRLAEATERQDLLDDALSSISGRLHWQMSELEALIATVHDQVAAVDGRLATHGLCLVVVGLLTLCAVGASVTALILAITLVF